MGTSRACFQGLAANHTANHNGAETIHEQAAYRSPERRRESSWAEGDVVELQFGMEFRMERINDARPTFANVAGVKRRECDFWDRLHGL